MNVELSVADIPQNDSLPVEGGLGIDFADGETHKLTYVGGDVGDVELVIAAEESISLCALHVDSDGNFFGTEISPNPQIGQSSIGPNRVDVMLAYVIG